jgi:hypothetical protein
MRRKLIAALCGLLMAAPLAAAGPAATAYEPLGSTSARNQVLHKGCHRYPFTYRVNPPAHTSVWSTEINLIGPRGGKVGSAYFVSPADPATGRSAWRMCRASLVPGKYTMKMKVTLIDGYDLSTTWVKPTTFRISRR